MFTEKTSPQSNSESLLLPDESYQIVLYENEIFDEVQFSSVIIQKVAGGYQVFGNSKTKPYFNITTSYLYFIPLVHVFHISRFVSYEHII